MNLLFQLSFKVTIVQILRYDVRIDQIQVKGT